MKNRAKAAFSAVVLVGTLPLLASSCQIFGEAYHFDITTMGIAPGVAVESPANTFRIPAGPAKRTLRVTVEARLTTASEARKTQPEFCTLDLGGRMPISFVPGEGDTFVGEVQTPTRFDAGKAAAGSLTCQMGGFAVEDPFKVVVVK